MGYAALVQALKILEHEVQITMALLGVRTLEELTSDLVERLNYGTSLVTAPSLLSGGVLAKPIACP